MTTINDIPVTSDGITIPLEKTVRIENVGDQRAWAKAGGEDVKAEAHVDTPIPRDDTVEMPLGPTDTHINFTTADPGDTTLVNVTA